MQGKVELCGVNTSKLPLLKNAEMRELIAAAQSGDMAARDKLINGNLRLVLSVIQKFSGRGESVCVMDQIGDTKNTDEHWLEQIALDEAVGRLSERERRILSLRFYLGRTQTEVAREIGISQAQVSRLEKNAMGRIKKELGS